ncbi:hypothetical protein [Bacillus alkalicellulosilyticus]|uniref:hypothetical protein n=1 Tax=Alkalihalobacterium alkalicellulosilyticum TaxID=1912214 RepID=UPI000995EB7E|nr:hypothetical protein [Bacillus alkalicellulosilyticus]
MDKEKRQISVKLNGKERTYKETAATRDTNNQASDPLPKKEEKKETVQPEIIDFREKHEERKERTQPFWDDGNHELAPKLPFNRKKQAKNKKSLKFSLKSFPFSILLAGLSAIIVGVSFGLMVLTIFTGESQATGENTQDAVSVESLIEAKQDGLPSLTVDVVQGGAYSTVEKGQEVVSSLKEKGLAGVLVESSDPIYMFIGVGQDREYANALSQLYQQQGQDTYVKPFTVAPSSNDEVKDEVKQFFQDGMALFEELALVSIRGIAGDEDILKPEQIEIALTAQADWEASKEEALSSLSEASVTQATKYMNAIKRGTEQLAKVEDSSDEEQLWKIQQALLEAMLAYEAFIDSL